MHDVTHAKILLIVLFYKLHNLLIKFWKIYKITTEILYFSKNNSWSLFLSTLANTTPKVMEIPLLFSTKLPLSQESSLSPK